MSILLTYKAQSRMSGLGSLFYRHVILRAASCCSSLFGYVCYPFLWIFKRSWFGGRKPPIKKAESDVARERDNLLSDKDDVLPIKETDDDKADVLEMKDMDDENEFKSEKQKYLSMSFEEKKDLVKDVRRKRAWLRLKDLVTWPQTVKDHPAHVLKNWEGKRLPAKYEVSNSINDKVILWQGDITTLEIDAIVNAANNSLLGGGGVDGAIHYRAGPTLVKECATLNGCDTGDAKITGGYKLPAKYVIHTVGPIGEKPDVLRSCYKTCLRVVKENKLKGVAFPCISTGIYGYPNKGAAQVVLETVREFLEKDEYAEQIDKIVFCLFMPIDVKLYEQYLPVYFPMPEEDYPVERAKKSKTEDKKDEEPKADSQSGDHGSLEAKEPKVPKVEDTNEKMTDEPSSDGEKKEPETTKTVDLEDTKEAKADEKMLTDKREEGGDVKAEDATVEMESLVETQEDLDEKMTSETGTDSQEPTTGESQSQEQMETGEKDESGDVSAK